MQDYHSLAAWNALTDKKMRVKADKVTDAMSGNLAALDSNGNIVDGGVSVSDVVEARTIHIVNSIATSAYVELETNYDIKYGELTALTLTLPDTITDTYRSGLTFTSGTTATIFSCPAPVKWSGAHIDINGALVPSPSYRYTIVFWYDGAYVCAVSRGVSIL